MTQTEPGLGHPRETDPAGFGIEVLRIATGIVWLFNLIFVVDPANEWFDPSRFAGIAASFGPSTPVGPAVANFIAANPAIFSWLLALMTAYLAMAFLLGITTRMACLVGFGASSFFLLTQWGAIWSMPGGTDVGAQPLYLAIYVALFLGGAGRHLALDDGLWVTWQARFPRILRLVAAAS